MRIPLITVIATGLAIGAAHAKPAPQDAAGNAGAQTQAITIKQPSEATIRARNEKIKKLRPHGGEWQGRAIGRDASPNPRQRLVPPSANPRQRQAASICGTADWELAEATGA